MLRLLPHRVLLRLQTLLLHPHQFVQRNPALKPNTVKRTRIHVLKRGPVTAKVEEVEIMVSMTTTECFICPCSK